MKKQNFYRLLFLAIILLFAAFSGAAQSKKPTYIINGDKLVKLEELKIAKELVKTSWTISIKDTVYPVYKGTKDSYFILRTSKKTGKEYRQYINIEEPKK